MFSRIWTTRSTENYSDNIKRLKQELETADAIVIGAGAGLSASAGFTYSGERFRKYFSDFHVKYAIQDMYSGGFYPFKTLEEYWGWWSRHIYVNRYMDTGNSVYAELLELVNDREYFILTTNVDHKFQKTGFEKNRLFYTQGDYGLWQCSEPCHQQTYDNKEAVIQMLLSQNFLRSTNGRYTVTDFMEWKTGIASELIPVCPRCGKPMTTNLRCDNSFVQDNGWYAANSRYTAFLQEHKDSHILYLELGVGANTPVIIKYPFWRMTNKNPDAVYACLNYGEAFIPKEIEKQSICIDDDIRNVLTQLK